MNNQEIVEQINELRKQQYALREKEEALDCQIIELRQSLIPIPKNGYYTNGKGLFCKVYDSSFEEICMLEINIEDNYIVEEIDNPYIKIETLEGIMKASIGDYIIKGVNGEFYPCKPDIFTKTYEEINS